MSIVERGLVSSGVELDEFNKPSKPPTKRAFAKVIKALREAESQAQEDERSRNRELRESQRALTEAMERIRILEGEVRKYKAAELAGELDLVTHQRQKLIAAVG